MADGRRAVALPRAVRPGGRPCQAAPSERIPGGRPDQAGGSGLAGLGRNRREVSGGSPGGGKRRQGVVGVVGAGLLAWIRAMRGGHGRQHTETRRATGGGRQRLDPGWAARFSSTVGLGHQ